MVRRLGFALTLVVTLCLSASAQVIGPGASSSTPTVTQGTSPWLIAPDGTSWAKTGTSANVATIPADTTTNSTALGALNDAISVNITGQIGAVFQLAASGTGVYTVTPECSGDGGTNYLASMLTPWATGIDAPTVTISSGQAVTQYAVFCPPGASHVRMRVSAYTSGTANWTARATVGGFPNSVPTLYNTAPTVSTANTAATVTLTGVAGQRWCIRGIVIFATAATSTTTTLTVSDGGTAVLDLGIPQLTTLSVPTAYSGNPVLCGSTGNTVTVNIGAGGTSVVTHTSVVAERG